MINGFYFWLACPRRTHTSIDEIQWNCKNEEVLGVDEVCEWQDWSERPTTEDQSRIESVLSDMDLSRKALLHVGVGNSEFAQNFCHRTRLIDGITIQKSELDKASTLQLDGYRVLLCNKFTSDLVGQLGENYDFIIDNNPSAFACCRKHFYTMLKSYILLLRPGGEIVTDKLGLGWSTTDNDPRWRLTPDNWFKIGAHFKLQAIRYSETVLALRKAP